VLKYGSGGVGLSRIFADSDVPKGSFYYYFSPKEIFGEALLRDYVAQYLARVDVLVNSPGTADDRLSKFRSAWLEQADAGGIASQRLVVKLGAEVADLSESMRDIRNDGIYKLVQRITDLLRQGAKDGSLRGFIAPEAMAEMLYAKWLGAAILSKLA